MQKQEFLGWILLAAALACPLAAHAQDYPSKPVKIILPNPAGGGPDVLARLVAEKLGEKWGQPVFVENRPGAAGNIGAEAVFRSPPDGYTLLFTPQPVLVINKALYTKLNFDPEAFAPISVLVSVPMVFVANPKVPAQTVQQLIAYAKENPDRLNYASAGSGSTPHLAAEYFKSRAGIKIVHVPYKGNAPGVADLLGGRIDLMMIDYVVLPHIRSGKLRAIAVLSAKRNPALPETPAVSEVLPRFAVAAWWSMAAPPKTPAAITEKISAEVAALLKLPEVGKRLAELGNLETVASTPAQMADYMKAERERWGNLIRAIGAKVD
ncbi:MAG: tripartite tricarboxylate transporter substrate binding protein [Betaproteobacteria bacterium]|nr:tripartite tricarboxylate transporter substrate binding protein [Betaproteobacteria bacterium]